MRIIAGEMRGRRLKTVEGWQTRPTADKVKGAIFNVLREKVNDAKVLDLFAGTGSLSWEALSRGAREASLVESNYTAFKVLEENARTLQVLSQTELFHLDAFTYLNRYPEQVFDLIFLDPPYRRGLAEQALEQLSFPCRLAGTGVIIVETSREENLTTGKFEVRQTGEYGDTKIWYLQRGADGLGK